VSRSTVSYVLNGTRPVSLETVVKVRASITRLGYRPNPAARALTLRRTGILGLLADVSCQPDSLESDSLIRFVQVALHAARRRGYDLLVMGNGAEELCGDVLADALVMMDVRPDEDRLAVLRTIGVPTALIGVPDDPDGFSAVDLDFAAAGRMLARRLIDLGHRRLGLIGTPLAGRQGLTFELRSRQGFIAEAGSAGLPVEDLSGWSLEQIRPVLAGGREDPVTGVFAADTAAIKLLSAVRADRPSVVAIALEHVLRGASPAVSGAPIPYREMVSTAVDLALDQLAGDPRRVVCLIPPEFLDLGSTASPAP
jgi:DNA-binding LacI/PurR family transcriptional regulator